MIYNPRTELLFPPHLIPGLKGLREEKWRALIEHLSTLPDTHEDTLAFCLMMIRLNACLSCASGSYRFMRGCELCAQQTISRFQGTDEELIALYEKAKDDLARYHRGEIELVVDDSAVPEPDEDEE